MKERIKTYLINLVSILRNRWYVMRWVDRAVLIGKLSAILSAFILVGWFFIWYALGPPSVAIGNVEVDLDRSLSLAGPDKDGNGIRDDIDLYIKTLADKKDYDKSQVKALQQEARSIQVMVTVNQKSMKDMDAADDLNTKAVHCLFLKFSNVSDIYAVARSTKKLTINTKPRMLAYMQYNHSRNGTVTALLEGNTCEL